MMMKIIIMHQPKTWCNYKYFPFFIDFKALTLILIDLLRAA